MCIGTALAQFSTPTNARVAALSGAHVSDISGVYRYPVLMTGYLDHIQATWANEFVGIKSVTDILSVGVLANQGPMSPFFTYDAIDYLNTYFADNTLFDTDIVVPHLLLGFNFGMVSVGADLFLEYGGYSQTDGQTNDDLTDYKGSISNPGFRLSGKVNLASAEILAKFGLGFPSISGSWVLDTNSSSRESEKGLYMEMGAEANLQLGAADLILGLCYTQSNYRFKLTETRGRNSRSQLEPETYTYSLFSAYIGTEFNFAETAVAMLGYSIDRLSALTVTDLLPLYNDPLMYSGERRVTDPISYWHSIYGGVENAWDKAWVFDSFQLRGGARYVINTLSGEASGGQDTVNGTYPTTEYSLPATHSRVIPTIGIGVSKAFATVDVSLNPGEWMGLFTGPRVAWVTATVKF